MIFGFTGNKLRAYSSGINIIHRILDSFLGVFILSYGIDDYLKLNIYFYYFLIYLLISISLKGMYGSFRTTSLSEIGIEVITNGAIIITSFFAINSFFLINKDSIIQLILLKSIIFFIYLFSSHILSRFILRIYRKGGGNQRSIMIVGDLKFRNKINNEIMNYPWMGYKIISWFSSNENTKKWEYKPDGSIKDIKTWLTENSPDQIIFSKENSKVSMDELLNILGDTPFPVCFFEDWFSSNMYLKSLNFGKIKLISIWSYPQSFISIFAKEIIDRVISLSLIILLFPLMALIALMIIICTKNNFLFKQNRVGINGKIFKIYKFRTMWVNESGDKEDLKQATKSDKRITSIGHFLRSYSLDELPQLFNVLNGSMSLVGPRPHAVTHNNFYRKQIKGYMQRHRLKPGITGLAQIKGLRGETKTIKEMRERINIDLEYINNWSILLDLKILFKTIFLFKSKSAY